jgi:hypothetical protein
VGGDDDLGGTGRLITREAMAMGSVLRASIAGEPVLINSASDLAHARIVPPGCEKL